MIEVGALVQKGAEVAVAELTKRAISAFKASVPVGRGTKELDFSKHFNHAFDRCTNIRTILKPDSQVDLLSCYVNLNHKIENKTLDDYEFIEFIKENKRVIVTGEGGGGKSMFMRYLWIAMTENSSGRIPIYIELKNLKGDVKLSEYMYYTASPSEDSDGMAKFVQMMKEGKFVFILDGFDEVRLDIRDRIQGEIFDISDEYKKNIIVVSGRPDDRYNGWSRFSRSKVCPLDKKQTIKLLERIDYFPDIVEEFMAKLRSDAFSAQKSFLERPLLLCMMLVTYKHFREIPNKLHLFYSNAFDALYREHDSYKDGFKRDLHVKVQPDVFRKILSYMCLFTYKEQKIEFSKHELLDYINKSLRASESTEKSEGYLNDLIESVCVIQKEGFVYSFVHRSFQEYFTAECLKTLDPRHCSGLLDEFSKRSSDNVIPMLNDMNQSLVLNAFILKYISSKRKLISDLASASTFSAMLSISKDDISGHVGIRRAGSTYSFGALMMIPPYNLNNVLSSVTTIMNCCRIEISKEAKKESASTREGMSTMAKDMLKLNALKELFPDIDKLDRFEFAFDWREDSGYSIFESNFEAVVLNGAERKSGQTVSLGKGTEDERMLDNLLTQVFMDKRQISAKCQKLKRSIPSIKRRKQAFDSLIEDALSL